MLIAGDIGGTKTNLALFDEKEDIENFSHLTKYPSQQYPNLRSIVNEFLGLCRQPSIEMACFAIAGPIQDGVCRATNLPWVIDAAELSKALKIPHVYLINDLEANAYAIEILKKESLRELYAGTGKKEGNRAVISPGTGLGEAGIYWDGTRHHPFACEGGHCEFGPRDEIQVELSRFICKKFGHPSYERILSGPGIHSIYQFFLEVLDRHEPGWLSEEMKSKDPSAVISENALNEKSELCVDVLNLFVSIFGSEAGNCVLKFMAMGGLYLGGGIPPKILPKLLDPIFFNSFVDKGRMRPLLEATPVRIILDDKASLKGAAHFCKRKTQLAMS